MDFDDCYMLLFEMVIVVGLQVILCQINGCVMWGFLICLRCVLQFEVIVFL